MAVAVGLLVQQQMDGVDDARAAWGETRPVLVARHDHRPGDLLVVDTVDLPRAAVPESAMDEVAAGSTARQEVAAGEVVVTGDLTSGIGPAGAVDDGRVVVPVSDPLVVTADIGVAVAVYSEGIVLAADAEIVSVESDVVFIAVGADDAPLVAAAAQTRTASIAFPGSERSS